MGERFERFAHSWRSDVLAVFAVGVAAKLAVARDVAVNGDSGLYLYDAQQILAGRIQFVDFPSRSPVFEHALAAVMWLGESPLGSARAFMLAVSMALGVAVYVFALQLHSHRAGIVAMALFYLTPFTLVWGAWVKTEQAAALTTLAAFIVAVKVIDRDRIPWWALGTVGALFATSYLIRRVAIVHIGAFALFVLWYRYRNEYAMRSTLGAAAGVVVAALATLAVAYLALVRGDVGLAWAVFDSHSLALFESAGQGSLGWINLGDPVAVTAESRDSLFAMLCQKCGVNTAVVFAKTGLVILPAMAALLVFARAGLRQLDAVMDYGVPVIVAGVVAWRLLRGDLTAVAALSIATAAVVVLAVWVTKPAHFSDVWNDQLALPLFVVVALAAGYLYRDRILYTTYFQDIFPFVATLSGVAVVAWLRRNRSVALRGTLAVVLVLAAVTAGVHADPYQPGDSGTETYWFTTDLVDGYGEDMDGRLPDGGRVFTAQPLYVIHSDARPLADLSRRYYLFRGWPEDSLTADLEADIVADLEAGTAPYAINDTNLQEMTSESPAIRTALADHYCRVDALLYDRTGATLLAHESTGECA